MDPLLTTEEVAGVLRLDVGTVRRLVELGDIAVYRVGGEYRFRSAAIEAYLARQQSGISGDTATIEHLEKMMTTRARTVLILARDEAVRLMHTHVGTEHLLLGLIAEEKNIVAKVLSSYNIGLTRTRSAIERLIAGQDASVGQEGISFAPRAKKALVAATDEVRRRGQNAIAPEHLFLGLLREGKEGIAGSVLVELGVDLNQARQQTIQEVWGS